MTYSLTYFSIFTNVMNKCDCTDRGTSFPMVAFVESQRADTTKHTTIVTVTFALIKITCPATVETNTEFTCYIRMYKAPRNSYWSGPQFNYTVVFGTTPPQVYNKISYFGFPAYRLRNVDQTINTPGTFTVTAYEADWSVQASTTITVTQSRHLQSENYIRFLSLTFDCYLIL